MSNLIKRVTFEFFNDGVNIDFFDFNTGKEGSWFINRDTWETLIECFTMLRGI